MNATLTRSLAALLTLGLFFVAARPACADGFSIVVHRTNSVSALSKSDLKKLFSGGTKQWQSGAVVQVGLIAADSPETAYLAVLLEMTQRELLQRIQEQVFKGEMRRPIVLRSSAECVALAHSIPGALCVAASGTPLLPDVHTVTVP